MSDYSDSIVYKIYKEDITEFYIGSTNNEKQRKKDHKSACNNKNSEIYNLKVYQFIRENGGYNNWNFEILEKYPCDNDIQLRIRERYYYDLLNPLLNMIRPYVSEEEYKVYQAKYKEEHNDGYKVYQAKYREEHKEQLNEYMKKYREDHKDDNKEYQLKYQAKYNEEYNEEKKERDAKYKEENKAHINQKHDCECGGNYTNVNKARHCNTNKHKTFLENNK